MGLAVQGGVEDFAGQLVTDLDGHVLEVAEACAPGQAVGPVGVAEDILGGGPEGRPRRIQQLGYVLRRHEVVHQGVR